MANEYKQVPLGERILCQCDDESCWKAVEVLPGSLMVHEDISDSAWDNTITIMLPEDVVLARVKKNYKEEVDLDWLATESASWAKRTFPWQNKEGVIAHLKREMRELAVKPDDPEEMADVFLLLVQVAMHHRVDLVEAVHHKYLKNMERTWGKPDGEGVSEHE